MKRFSIDDQLESQCGMNGESKDWEDVQTQEGIYGKNNGIILSCIYSM